MGLALDPHYFRRFFGLIFASLAIYVVFLAVLVLLQRQLMYFPDPTDFKPEAYGFSGFERITYKTKDGLQLHGFYAPPLDKHKPTLIFFQGNAGDLGQRADKIKLWQEWGYGLFLPTYRGYHGNAGSPTEEGLYDDARAALRTLKDAFKIDRKDLIIYGESLGTGIAVQMAVEGDERGLVLEVPYTMVPDIGSHRYPFVPIFWLAWDRFESINKIRGIKSPLLVLKAGHDTVIPSILAQRLFDKAAEPKKLVTHPTADHMDIYTSPAVVNEIRKFMLRLSSGY
jgi:fermentation-respiration switch protein FrsA (DUF1100 family)